MLFEVWAPGSTGVELVLADGQRAAMARGERGRWHIEVPGAGPGTRYWYALDGGPPRPDPRSASQPEGIDGPSMTVDHWPFPWHDQGWRAPDWEAAIIYELHIGTFSPQGTFDGAIALLGHLVELGVNTVELLPVAEAGGERGWGYDGVDLWAPHHAYGGPEGLKRLVDACHTRGLAIVLDVVYNHLGPTGNYLAEFGPYFTDEYRTPWGTAVNMDGTGSYGARDFVVSNAIMWLRDYHFDGLRLDAVHAIFDESPFHVLEQLSTAVDRLAADLARPLWLIAENGRNDPRVVRPRDEHGYGLAACWDDDFHHALHTVLTGEDQGYYADYGRIADLAKAFTSGFVYDGEFSEHFQRYQGGRAEGMPGSAFVVCLQNHDQVGNRALGERLAALVEPGWLKVGAALLLLSPYVPMLFQGEEWGASTPFLYFTDHRDPDLARAVSEGRRREHPMPDGQMVPDPQDPATFLRSKLDWEERDKEPHRSLLEWHKRLLQLRRSEPDLAKLERALVSTAYDEELRWLVVRRGRFSVVANLAAERQAVPVRGPGTLVLASDGRAQLEGACAWLPAGSVAVVAH
ncbi:MAG TPA: malto-oligosyltrehalose trehalohydrolase [Acidimicrobiales bacterium]|nr:malto-oligosyltrehalose trehalohydrolase [Acidimicrobiales bacterium]